MATSRSESRTSRPASSLAFRPPSALSSSTSYATGVPKTPKTSAARYGGLAERDLQKITSSIRTATKTTGTYRSRTTRERERDVEETDLHEAGNDSLRELAPSGSFISEASFSRAPLNSRLPPISPHRVVIAAAAAAAGPSKARKSDIREEDSEDDELAYLDSEDDVGVDAGEGGQGGARERKSRRKEGLDKESLVGLSSELQEALIVEDLLFVLMGIEGQYIEYDPSYRPEDEFERLQGAQFITDPSVDPWLSSVVTRLLPLATYYTSIHAFVEQYSLLEHGVINHALCSAIRDMLREYLVLLAQLEHEFLTSPQFTLQRLWFHLHPTLHTLSLLHTLTSELVALNVDTSPDDSSSVSEGSTNDGIGGEGLRDVLNELRGRGSSGPGGAGGGIAKGGEVLAVLSSLLVRLSGDPTAAALFSTLLLLASQPYVTILLDWISKGVLIDPWDEFIVKEGKGITRGGLGEDYTDEYWEKRYTLRDAGVVVSSGSGDGAAVFGREKGLVGGAVVPSFLRPWRSKILLAGKYLNVIRECGIEVKVPDSGRLGGGGGELVAMNEEAFYKRIDEAYTYANKTLLKLLVEEQHLASRLKSIKQYFFIDHGDSFTHFLDVAKHELNKKKKHASATKLQSLLDLALRNPASASSADPFKEDLKATLAHSTLTEWLVKVVNVSGAFGGEEGVDALGTGMMEEGKREEAAQEAEKSASTLLAYEAFTLDYTVKFPLSLVISRKTILRYQLIFRHLLQLKHLERVLTDTWTEHVKSTLWRKKSPYPELEQWKGRVFALRARMFAFVQQMYSFAVSGVLEFNWKILEGKLQKVETVDQLLRDHVDFLDTCLKDCLLTNEKLLQLHSKLVTVCTLFASYTSHFTRSIATALALVEKAGGDWDQVRPTFQKQWDFLSKFEQNFNHHSKTNLERIAYASSREQTALLPLVIRLTSLSINTQ